MACSMAAATARAGAGVFNEGERRQAAGDDDNKGGDDDEDKGDSDDDGGVL
jgi:hypothetical protein